MVSSRLVVHTVFVELEVRGGGEMSTMWTEEQEDILKGKKSGKKMTLHLRPSPRSGSGH